MPYATDTERCIMPIYFARAGRLLWHSVASVHSYAGDRPVGYCVDTPVLVPALMKDMLQLPKSQSAFQALGRTAIKHQNRPVLQFMVYLAYCCVPCCAPLVCLPLQVKIFGTRSYGGTTLAGRCSAVRCR